MSTARKQLILRRASMPVVSELREGMENIADAVRTLAGVMASVAAAAHTNNPGDQRNMAMVIFEDARERFGDVHKKMDAKQLQQMQGFLDGLCRGRR